MSKFFHDQGVVIRKLPHKERDETVLLLTQHHGKMWFTGYGSRMPKSRKAASLQLFNTVDFVARTYLKQIPSLEQVSIVSARGFGIAKKSLDFFERASALLKIMDDIVWEGQRTEAVFECLEQSLNSVENPNVVQIAIIKIFTRMGFFPDWKLCCHCGIKIHLKDELLFCGCNKGFSHRRCCDRELDRSHGSAHRWELVPVSHEVVKVMAFFQSSIFEKTLNLIVSSNLRKDLQDILDNITIHV